MLKKELQVNELILIPVQPNDLTGHSDGMVRFYNENTILVNKFDESVSWMERYNRAIRLSGLEQIPFPFKHSEDKADNDEYTAHGCYINFAQIGKTIIFPQFGGEFSNMDKLALKRVEKFYPECAIEPINVDSISLHGGVLNCCTWNIHLR